MTPLLGLYIYWHLPLLIVLICIVYSATRHDDWQTIWHEAFRWIVRMSGFLGAIALALLVVHWLI